MKESVDLVAYIEGGKVAGIILTRSSHVFRIASRSSASSSAASE